MHTNFQNIAQVLSVPDFQTLIKTSFQEEVNALCWERSLEGDFEEIVHQLVLEDDITEVSVEMLNALKLSEKGNRAREIILQDIQKLTEFGAQPSLNLLKKYDRDEELDFISTDVYSYHVDQSPIASDTFLCTYYGAASDILPNHQAIQSILIPEVRNQLKSLYNGSEEDFEDFLKENFFDLHYEALPGAEPINLGNGHLWRLAIAHPFSEVLPCIHRAPEENGEYRLLLIC
ncbi:MAG: DUF1826 domain-containing protein [Bacteroidetes bacterium]|nr:DUF1826 domain-containing protein [Bacteroidota bacterium]